MKVDRSHELITLCVKNKITDTESLIEKLTNDEFKNTEDGQKISEILDHILDASEYAQYETK